MPNDLVIKKLGEITKVLKMGLSSYHLKGGNVAVKIINAKDIANGIININSVDTISVKRTPQLDRSRIASGDLILTTKGSSTIST